MHKNPGNNGTNYQPQLVSLPDFFHLWLWKSPLKLVCPRNRLKKLPKFSKICICWHHVWFGSLVKHPTYEFGLFPPQQVTKSMESVKNPWVSKFGKRKRLLWPGIFGWLSGSLQKWPHQATWAKSERRCHSTERPGRFKFKDFFLIPVQTVGLLGTKDSLGTSDDDVSDILNTRYCITANWGWLYCYSASFTKSKQIHFRVAETEVTSAKMGPWFTRVYIHNWELICELIHRNLDV